MQVVGRSATLVAVAAVMLAATTSAHMMSLGRCKDYKGMADFDPAQFEGTWYVIKKLITRSDCLTINYNMMEDGESFKVEEVRRPPYSDIIPVDLSVTNAGVLSRRSAPSEFSVKWYNGIMPVYSNYMVVTTDYGTYAVEYECQNILNFLNRKSAAILSRTPTLNDTKVAELVEMLKTDFDIPSNRLNSIDQDNCIPLEDNDFNLVIDENGFNSALQNYQELETLAQNSPKEIVEIVQSDQGSG